MAKDRRIELLQKVPLFWGCNTKELKRIAQITDLVEVAVGEQLMKEGDAGREMMVIADGTVSVDKGGARIGQAGAGEVIGELALLDQGPRTATVTADTPVSLYVVSSQNFNSLLMDAPSVAVRILRNMAARLRDVESQTVQ